MERLDATDLKILKTVQSNGRLTTKELAAQVGLSATPVFERLKRLEREGYIRKYTAVLDAEKLDCGFMVICNVKLKQINASTAAEFTAAVSRIDEVGECYNISGEFDYLLKIHARNMKHYQELLINVIGALDCVGSLQSVFVMDEIKHEYGIPIPSLPSGKR